MVEPSEVFQFTKDSLQQSSSIEGGWELAWQVPLALAYFDGHFPGKPVLPGIAILDASLEAINLVTGNKNCIHEISSAKFTGLVTPGAQVTLLLKAHSAQEWEIQWLDANPKTESKNLAKIQCKTG